MRPLVCVATLSVALRLLAQTRSVDGVVKNASGTPVGGMAVALTLLPIDDAEDVTATTITDAGGRFHVAELRPGRYGVAASSEVSCGGATTIDVTTESSRNAVVLAAAQCRTVSGLVTGGIAGAHVIAGHFHDDTTDVYSAAVRDGRYKLTLPMGGTVVVQAIAPRFKSVETAVIGSGDASPNLVLERLFAKMPPEARRWIAAKAIPLTTVEAGNGFSDLAPLRRVVGDARIVALGEATHGTREFFQFKHRMLEYLVANMGFNVFAIEASAPDALAIDDYVLTGNGDPTTALRNLGFWTWNTEEVLAMIRWMRKWNEDPSHSRKVRFYGFDMQNPAAAQRLLRKWLTVNLADAIPLLDRTALLAATGPKRLTADQQKDVTQAVAAIAARLDAYSPHDAAWQSARHLADLLSQAIPPGGGMDSSARDRAMAQNIEWIAGHEAPDSRIVVWAHNGHVSAEHLAFAPGGTMGVQLRKMFGREMLIVGFAFDHGSFRAVDQKKGLIEQKAAPLDESSFDHALASSGPRVFVIDLRPARGTTRRWLDSPLPMRSIGAVYDEATPKSYVSRIHPLRSFDAIFFVNETTAARQVRIPMAKPAASAVNLSLDDGLAGWILSKPSIDAGFVVSAKTEGCFRGGCAEVSRTAERGSDGFGSFAQRIDATPFRGKKIRLRAKIKSSLAGAESSARIWLRVDRPDGIGFFDNMGNRAPHSLPEWTDLEITGDVASDAEAVAFGMLMQGGGVAWIDSVTLEVVQ
jgi:erythromycin esterase